MNNISHPSWIEINLSAIEHNTKKVLEKAKVPIMAVVKNDAYGHGALECARTMLNAGASWLAVVRCYEAKELREAGIDAPIFVFGGALPNEIDLVLEYDLILPVYDRFMAKLLSERAVTAGKIIRVHLKVDTGMGRFGVFPDQAVSFAQELLQLPGLRLDGVLSHFAVADVAGHPLTEKQIERFTQVVQDLHDAGIKPEWVHQASSPAIFHHQASHFTMVRAGGALLCVGLSDENDDPIGGLRRAFTWKAGLISCKRFPAGWGIGYGQDYITSEGEIIGVVPVGHGDGFLRNPHNEVLIGGHRVPVVGQVCMDQFMVSLPQMYPIGTEVVLVGCQGDERITPEEVGQRWNTSASAATEIKERVPRFYVYDEKE